MPASEFSRWLHCSPVEGKRCLLVCTGTRNNHRRVELERWRSVERRVEDPGEHRVGFMVMASGGVFFPRVLAVLTWREHSCKPQKGDPTDANRCGVGLRAGGLGPKPLASKPASKQERERVRGVSSGTCTDPPKAPLILKGPMGRGA